MHNPSLCYILFCLCPDNKHSKPIAIIAMGLLCLLNLPLATHAQTVEQARVPIVSLEDVANHQEMDDSEIMIEPDADADPLDTIAASSWLIIKEHEYVVTGSWLERRASNSPWLFSVLKKSNLDVINAMDVTGLVKSLPYDLGSIGNADSFSGGDNSTGNAGINLRGLGMGSTLVLLDSKRLMANEFDKNGSGYTDLSGLIPSIALERIEIIRGSSASVYGLEASAGVVNFSTRQGFNGIEIQADYSLDDSSGKQQNTFLSGLIGASNDSSSFLLAISYLQQLPLQIADRYASFGGSAPSVIGQPGSYIPIGETTTPSPPPPSRFFNGNPSGIFANQQDPDCQLAGSSDGIGGTQEGILTPVGDRCAYDTSGFYNLVGKSDNLKMYFSGRFIPLGKFELHLEAFFADNDYSHGNPLYASSTPVLLEPSLPGLQLDAQRRGIEPISYLALQRIQGGSLESASSLYPIATETNVERNFYYLNLGFKYEFNIFGLGMRTEANMSYNQRNLTSLRTGDTLTDRVTQAYAGNGGFGCNTATDTSGSGNNDAGSCYYYNPFATSIFDPLTGLPWASNDNSPWAANTDLTVAQATQLYSNPVDLLQWLSADQKEESTNKQFLIEGLLATEFLLGSKLAIGTQWRQETITTDYDVNLNANAFSSSYGAQDFTGSENTFSAFAEFYWPVFSFFQVNAAGRYELSNLIGDTDSAVIETSLIFRPFKELTLKASASASVKVPSLMQVYGSNTVLLNSVDDFSEIGGPVFLPVIVNPNPDLVTEKGRSYTAGFAFTPKQGSLLGGLNVNLGAFYYDHDDPIFGENHQTLINTDNSLRCPDGPNRESGVLCGTSGTVVNSLGEGFEGIPEQVIRDQYGYIERVITSYINGTNLQVAGAEIDARYQFGSGDWNRFALQLLMTYLVIYDYTDQNGNKINALGNSNADNDIGRPIPALKSSMTGYWRFGKRHDLVATINHIFGYNDSLNYASFRTESIRNNSNPNRVESWTTLDLSYSITVPPIFTNRIESHITFSIKNVLATQPPVVNTDGGYEPLLHNALGRIWHARFSISF